MNRIPVLSRLPSRRRWGLVAAVAGAVVLLSVSVSRWWTDSTPKRFAEVEPGQIYRSGELSEAELRNIIAQYKIKTVLSLLQPLAGAESDCVETRVGEELHVRKLQVGMPGNGRGSFADLDEAADIMADPANRPILVHCAAGVNRTGAVLAAYRMKHCGWAPDKAIAEGDRWGWSIESKPSLAAHMRDYYSTCVTGTSGRGAVPSSRLAGSLGAHERGRP